MHLLKKIGRFLIISMFVILASFGLGFTGVNHRELFQNNENRIEMLDKRDEEDEDEAGQNQIIE
jgi:hypothetical protein